METNHLVGASRNKNLERTTCSLPLGVLDVTSSVVGRQAPRSARVDPRPAPPRRWWVLQALPQAEPAELPGTMEEDTRWNGGEPGVFS